MKILPTLCLLALTGCTSYTDWYPSGQTHEGRPVVMRTASKFCLVPCLPILAAAPIDTQYGVEGSNGVEIIRGCQELGKLKFERIY